MLVYTPRRQAAPATLMVLGTMARGPQGGQQGPNLLSDAEHDPSIRGVTGCDLIRRRT
jgi:hypothetical protein